MKVLKSVGECCLVFLAVIGVVITLVYGYYSIFVKEQMIGINYIADQVGVDIVKSEDLTETEKDKLEERWFLQANYYSNDKENGIELQELNFNYFTDYTLTSDKYRSTGMQYKGDYKHTDVRVSNDSERDNYVFKQFVYYDTTDGSSYSGQTGSNAAVSTLLKRSTRFVIKIDNRAFMVQLDKSYRTGWWIFGTTHYYTWSELFESVFAAIKSCSAGYGDYYITVDLSDYFTIYEYDMETGKFKADNVTNIIKNYSVLKFHYDENGAVKANQSIFGQIECDKSFGMDVSVNTDYWQQKGIYNLNESTLYLNNSIYNFRYSEVYGGYFISLKMDVKELLSKVGYKQINIKFDLDSLYLKSKKINLVGIDYDGFANLEISKLTLTGNNQTFYLLDRALHNTKLTQLEHSEGITLDIAENAVNSEFEEVLL